MSAPGVDHPFEKLLELMETLRGPDGCPWDREQTRETLKPMLVEEAFEVLEALDDEDSDGLCEELGDLLFQVVFHSQIAKEKGEFDALEVCRRLHDKMVQRHPHVFGDESFADSQELLRNWESLKESEKRASGRKVTRKDSLLDGMPDRLPALYRANLITAKAARVGFDWPSIEGITDKLLEEVEELNDARRQGADGPVKEELGDVLFTAVNLCRRLEIDPETALNRANRKFSQRFRRMEKHFGKEGRELKDVEIEEMENCWNDLKACEAS